MQTSSQFLDAKESAAHKLSLKLATADRLDKVGQLISDTTRSLEAVETQLRTLVAAQLDEAREGKQLLERTNGIVRGIRENFLQVDVMYKASQDLFPEYDKIKSIEKVRRNLRNTIRDINTVLGISDRVAKCKEMVEDRALLLEAHKEVRHLERLRDAFLAMAAKDAPRTKSNFERFFRDVEEVSRNLDSVLGGVLQDFLINARRDPATLVRALRVIEREEAAIYKRGSDDPDVGRKRLWVLEQLSTSVKVRFERCLSEGNSLEEKLRLMDFVQDDLTRVVDDVGPCFPPVYGIFHYLVQEYHGRVADLIHEAIEDRHRLQTPQILALVTWTWAYHSQLSNRLGITEVDPRLDHLCEPLLDQYVDETKDLMSAWLRQMLKLHLTEKPYNMVENVAYAAWISDLFKMVRQQIDLASRITHGEPLLQVTEACGGALTMFVQAWLETLQKHGKQIEVPYLVALANSALQSMDHTRDFQTTAKELLNQELKERLNLEESVDAFHQLSRAAVAICVSILFADEVEVAMEEFFTKHSAEKRSMPRILATLKDYFGDLRSPMNSHLFTKLVGDSCDYLISVYVEALLKSSWKMTPAGEKMMRLDEREITELFCQYTSRPKLITRKTQALKLLLELLTTDAYSMAVPFASLNELHPDFTVDIVKLLLNMRADMSKKDKAEALETCTVVWNSKYPQGPPPVTDGLFARILGHTKEKASAEQRGLFKNLFAKPSNSQENTRVSEPGGKGSPSVHHEDVTDLDDFLNG